MKNSVHMGSIFGMFKAFRARSGRNPKRRERHIKSQMKFFGGSRGKRNSQTSWLGSPGGRVRFY